MKENSTEYPTGRRRDIARPLFYKTSYYGRMLYISPGHFNHTNRLFVQQTVREMVERCSDQGLDTKSSSSPSGFCLLICNDLTHLNYRQHFVGENIQPYNG
jgi:hypothetical protein